MCRLLAYVTREPASPLDLLGEQLPEFVALSRLHGDGWGVAWYESLGATGAPNLVKAPEAAHASATFAEAMATIRADALMAHIRWATPGMILCGENTHPFVSGSLAFGHNGALEPLDAVDPLIAPRLRDTIVGTTDSERYFLALASALERLDPVAALRATLTELHGRTRSSSLNALLLTSTALYAIADYDPDARMERQQPGYYELSYHVSPEAVMVGSSGWQQGAGWRVIPNGHALCVERGTLRTEIVSLAERASAGAAPQEAGKAGARQEGDDRAWQTSLER
jgi:predicted glutamine amidotransferase